MIKKNTDVGGVLPIVFEFILSAIVLGGGGWMMATGHGNDFVASIMTMVAVFWFQNRQTEKRDQVRRQEFEQTVSKVAPLMPPEQAEEIATKAAEKVVENGGNG